MTEDGEVKGAGSRWSWQPGIWRWRPEETPWRPDLGLPSSCVRLALDMGGVAPRERFELWRSVTGYDFAFDRPTPQQRADFNASCWGLISARGILAVSNADGFSGRSQRLHNWDSDIWIGLVLSGERSSIDGDGVASVNGPGSFFAYDANRATRVSWSRYDGVHVGLRRQAVVAALGASIPPMELLARLLAASPLALFLRDQLLSVVRYGGALGAGERAVMLNNVFDLVLETLSQASQALNGGAGRVKPMLHAAAMHHIGRTLSDPELDAVGIARAVGCSRATLYRAFEDHEMTVADALRQARLERIRHLLIADPRASIGSIALRCGLPQARTFNRMFKQAFGMTPKELRRSETSSSVPRG